MNIATRFLLDRAAVTFSEKLQWMLYPDGCRPDIPSLALAANDEWRVVSDLGSPLPVLKAEIGILRAFLADEINAILFGTEP